MKRIIPLVVIDGGKAYHRLKFKNNIYIGDPINICRIFGEKNCDELIIFDITKKNSNNVLHTNKLEKISQNIFVPVSFGGGIYNKSDIDKVFASGIEKIVFKFQKKMDLELVKYCSDKYGQQSIILAINIGIIKSRFFSLNFDYLNQHPLEFKKNFDEIPHGELLVQFVSLSGTKLGYDMDFSQKIMNEFKVPLIYSGGIKNYIEIKELFELGYDAVSCSTLFTLHPVTGAPLISYLDWEERLKLNLI